jgi:nucleotide-binding universal stress UspA family protein
METKEKNVLKYNSIILIPTDFSETCENAINHGAELARFLNYKVSILHVIDKQDEQVQEKNTSPLESLIEKLQKYKKVYEDKYKVTIDILVRNGNILKVINLVATELKANLVVLGTHGKQGFQHLFGSYALKVVLDSPCPVIVVQKRSFDTGYRDIVLPVSNDVESRHAIEWIRLMSRLFNSTIHLYKSVETDPAMINRLNIIIQQISKVLTVEKIPFTLDNAGKPKDFANQVIAYGVANKSDLIMIITMPGEGLPGFNFSIWDERMMFNEAQIPVMCINPVELGQYYYDWMG